MMESTFNIPITSLNDIISIEIPNYENNVGFQKTVESDSDYIRVEYVVATSGPYIRIDSTGKCTVGCSEPWDMNENIVIKYKGGSGYIYTDVNNGDGTITRTITSDSLPSSISFRAKSDLTSVSYLNVSNVTDMTCMFYYCESLTSIDLSNWDTSKVTDMNNMFYNCRSLTILDISSFDTSNVTSMQSMFSKCSNLTSLDLSNFNTSKVTDMRSMFNFCTSLTSIDLSSFNTSSVTTMNSMFYQCSSLTSLDVSGFDTSNVTTMYCMFDYCSKLTSLDVSNFDTSKVTNMGFMFLECSNLTSLDLSNWKTSNVETMRSMFFKCTNLTSLDLSSFDTSKATDMTQMFNMCSNLISVNMTDTDYNLINKIITELPTRGSNSYGTITVSKDVLNSVNETTANSKYWNVVKVPEYTFTLDTLKYLLTNIKNKFVTKEELNNKVDKVEGKQLSANNFSDEDINNINNSFDDAEVIDNVSSELTTLKFYSGNNETKTIDLDI